VAITIPDSDIDLFYDDVYLRQHHLGGVGAPPETVTIVGVSKQEFRGTDNKLKHKCVLKLAETPLPFGMCRTDAKQVAEFYGTDTKRWLGRQITLVVRIVDAFGKKTPAIRVLEQPPSNGHTTAVPPIATHAATPDRTGAAG